MPAFDRSFWGLVCVLLSMRCIGLPESAGGNVCTSGKFEFAGLSISLGMSVSVRTDTLLRQNGPQPPITLF